MKTFRILSIAGLLFTCAFACNETTDQKARDTIASANGLIAAAQAEYLDSCKANPSQGTCVLINKSVDSLNITITALETYCGFALAPIPPAASAKCAPVQTAQSGLSIAVANLATLLSQLQPLVNPAPKKTSALFDRKLENATFSDIESLRLESL